MIKEFEGYLLKKIKYSDNSLILTIYSHKEGLLPLFYRIKKKDNYSYMLPLIRAEGTFYYKQINEVFHIKSISFNTKKDVDVQFYSYEKTILRNIIATIFYNICIYPARDFNLYELIEKTYTLICTKQYSEIKHLHIWILKELTNIMGFRPINNYSKENLFFNIESGQFVKNKDNELTLDDKLSELLSRILNLDINSINNMEINQNQETKIITFFEKYFTYHLHKHLSFKDAKEYLNLLNPVEKVSFLFS